MVLATSVVAWFYLKSDGRHPETDDERRTSNSNSHTNDSRSNPANSQQDDSPNKPPSESASLSFNELTSRAEAGDAESQRRLSELHEFCWLYVLDSQQYLDTAKMLIELSGSLDGAHHLNVSTALLEEKCAGIDLESALATQQGKTWLTESAKNGDITSIIRRASRGEMPLDEQQRLNVVRSAIESRDPEIIFELSALLGDSSSPSGIPSELTGRRAEYAWAIVACRMGATSCQRASMHMTNICLAGICQYDSYESFLSNEMLTTADQQRVMALIDQITAYIDRR